MNKYVMAAVMTASLVGSTTVLGAEIQPLIQEQEIQETVQVQKKIQSDLVIEGISKVVKANDAYNINPYNIASITGVGEGNVFRIISTYKTIDIPLAAPLYSVSDVYKDKILQKNNLWGVERNVSVKVFDGSEDWSLLPNPGYRNNNTTIFTAPNTEQAIVRDGLCTHFDVFSDKDQKNNIYDGISFGRTTSEFYMRIMNVRNITTVDALKTYLKAQYDAGTPVKFFFAAPEPTFEPFSDEIQNEINSVDLNTIGFVDKNLQKMTTQEKPVIENNCFLQKTTGNEKMDEFLAALTDLKIFKNADGKKYYVESVKNAGNGFGLTVKEETTGAVFYGELETKESNYTSSKPAELILKSNTVPDTFIKVQFDLTKVSFPVEDSSSFHYSQTGIKEDCIVETELVLADYIPVVEGLETGAYLKNTILNSSSEQNEVIQVPQLSNGMELINNILYGKGVTSPTTVEMTLDGQGGYQTNWVPVDKNAGQGQERVVMFLGDSLLNQDIYTTQVAELFEGDPMKIKMIGTRGVEGAMHEGRGGWSAYDYCNVESKYGYTNPFLKDGEFDFAYYMAANKYEHVDDVVINLGINDLNLAGHNSHEEIIGYFDKILNSIRAYDSNIKVLFNTPTMLYGESKTDTAKDVRLEFIKQMKEVYGGREDEGIYVIPVYLGIDPYMGFKLTEPIIDEYNQNHALIVNDTTHPSNRGYRAMAEITYSFLKYIAENETK